MARPLSWQRGGAPVHLLSFSPPTLPALAASTPWWLSPMSLAFPLAPCLCLSIFLSFLTLPHLASWPGLPERSPPAPVPSWDDVPSRVQLPNFWSGTLFTLVAQTVLVPKPQPSVTPTPHSAIAPCRPQMENLSFLPKIGDHKNKGKKNTVKTLARPKHFLC